MVVLGLVSGREREREREGEKHTYTRTPGTTRTVPRYSSHILAEPPHTPRKTTAAFAAPLPWQREPALTAEMPGKWPCGEIKGGSA